MYTLGSDDRPGHTVTRAEINRFADVVKGDDMALCRVNTQPAKKVRGTTEEEILNKIISVNLRRDRIFAGVF